MGQTGGSESIIVIPARRASTRLKDKLLQARTGKPVLAHSIERALEACAYQDPHQDPAARVWVACDDPALAEVATAAGAQVVIVDEPCESGTERISKALRQLPKAYTIVNLQADEPDMPKEWIADCLMVLQSCPGTPVATVAVGLDDDSPQLHDPNAVKVVLDSAGYAMYFSRSTIPYVREGGTPTSPRALLHLGIYAYSTSFLRRLALVPASDLERSECLEQLRFLQAGARMRVLVRSMPTGGIKGIDTPADYEQFCRRHAA